MQLDIASTFRDPTDWANWPQPTQAWAVRLSLHHRWLELGSEPGGLRLRGEKMLNALSGLFVFTVPTAARPEIGSPGKTHTVPDWGLQSLCMA